MLTLQMKVQFDSEISVQLPLYLMQSLHASVDLKWVIIKNLWGKSYFMFVPYNSM
jgi:hypothetical protein